MIGLTILRARHEVLYERNGGSVVHLLGLLGADVLVVSRLQVGDVQPIGVLVT